jgi:hypothetical protein
VKPRPSMARASRCKNDLSSSTIRSDRSLGIGAAETFGMAILRQRTIPALRGAAQNLRKNGALVTVFVELSSSIAVIKAGRNGKTGIAPIRQVATWRQSGRSKA